MKTLVYIIILTFLLSCNYNRQDNSEHNLDNKKIDSTLTAPNEKSQKEIDLETYSLPFDTSLINCLHTSDGKGQTTMGMIDCYYNAINILDSLVNKMYNKLSSKLDKTDKQKLKKSQDNWRKYYSAESDFLFSAFYTWANSSKNGHGREHAITQAEWRYDVMRKRLIDLTKYDTEIFIEDSISK